MADKIKTTASAIAKIIDGKIDKAGNENLKKNWTRERAKFIATGYAGFFTENEIDPKAVEGLAIYAAQKVRRLIGFAKGLGDKIDPYTANTLRNAFALKDKGVKFTTELQMAGLCRSVEAAERTKLVETRHSDRSTANTQSCSTRAALEALGAMKVTKEDGKRVLDIDFEHPVVKAVVSPAEEKDEKAEA